MLCHVIVAAATAACIDHSSTSSMLVPLLVKSSPLACCCCHRCPHWHAWWFAVLFSTLSSCYSYYHCCSYSCLRPYACSSHSSLFRRGAPLRGGPLPCWASLSSARFRLLCPPRVFWGFAGARTAAGPCAQIAEIAPSCFPVFCPLGS